MRIWLHEGHDGDPGWEAWSFDHLGFATYAPTRDAVLERVPAKLDEHVMWLALHGAAADRPDPGIEVVEELHGNEVLFTDDRVAASPAEIELALTLLDASRADLVAELDELPDEALDWDPPYTRFADWATWRTIREIVAHLANTETHYYGAHVGMRPATTRVRPDDDWRAYLARTRSQTRMFLGALQHAPDRARVTEQDEHWSVRKALRRMVRHELMHTRSIRRIVLEYDARRA